MLLIFILLFCLPVFLYILLSYYEYSVRRTIKNIKNPNEIIKGNNIFFLIKFVLKGIFLNYEKSLGEYSRELTKNHGIVTAK